MDTLSTLEDQINDVTLNAERREFELWKEKEELKLQSFAASKRCVYIYIMDKIKCLDMFTLREQLKEKEDRLRHEFEQHDTIQQQKRVELYEANFNAELEDYKRRRENEVSSLYSRKLWPDRYIWRI
jgi:phage-related minor tail protein